MSPLLPKDIPVESVKDTGIPKPESTGIRNICVIGAGFMGWQIGLHCAVHGLTVTLVDVAPNSLKKALDSCDKVLQDRVSKGDFTVNQCQEIKTNLHWTQKLQAAATADLVIEAIPEKLEAKQALFEQLDQICSPHTILASNSSSLWIDSFAFVRPSKVLNMHFYPLIWDKPLVELGGNFTSAETMACIRSFLVGLDLIPVTVLKESTGFLFNRIWRAIKKEALTIVEQGIASYEDVDRAWMSTLKTSSGPFGLMDMVGLDVVRDIEQVYWQKSGNPADAPPSFLMEMITQGKLGVKTGQGFYTYPDPDFQKPEWLKRGKSNE